MNDTSAHGVPIGPDNLDNWNVQQPILQETIYQGLASNDALLRNVHRPSQDSSSDGPVQDPVNQAVSWVRTHSGGPWKFCQWDNCGHVLNPHLQEVTIPVVRAHFKAMHPKVMISGTSPCLWSGCRAPGPLKYTSLPKHIANCHLGAGLSVCGRCRSSLSTKDSLARHMLFNCSAYLTRCALIPFSVISLLQN